jgi:DNA-binding MarR family transcriptional regulator
MQPLVFIDSSRLENLIGYHLKKAYFCCTSEMEGKLKKLGISLPEFAILTLIESNPGITQSRLHAHLHISRSWCSEMVDQLLEKKLIQRDAINRKSYGLYIGPSGEAKLRKYWLTVSALESTFKARLTETESKLLTSLLKKITADSHDDRTA